MRYVRLNGMDEEDYRQYRARVESSCHLIGEARLAELLGQAGFGAPAPFYRGLEFGGWIAARR